MHPADFSRVETLFADIVMLGPADRNLALDERCADRLDLRRRVEALLDAHDRLPAESDAGADSPAWPPLGAGSPVGPFRLIEPIGSGGMGAVFRAERTDGAFTQEVAVKVVRPAFADAELMQRFKTERQILASLRHPNIVTLLDGGATPDGRAFLVMELVNGVEIVRHCREHALSLEERLRLFGVLCTAVQYAHQHGVVHRDLKPANILIGSDGAVKVLDFGVAKLLQGPSGGDAATLGLLPGPLTPNYASPEQLRGEPVTTASDVYALGILLYELVADVRPYETAGLTLDRVLEVVIHTEPARPSARSSRRQLRGDIDAIVMKAISKDPTHRYASAGELGGDVARFLGGDPVLARGPSTAYLLRRIARRNKAVVATGAVALLVMLATSSIALWQRQIARREQARAEQRFNEVRQLTNAFIFKIHDAVAPLAGSTPVRRTIVDEALAYLERLQADAGAGDVTLRLELAAAYRQIAGILGDPQRANLGDRDGAIRQYERARAILLPLADETASFDVLQALSRTDGPLTTLYNLQSERTRSNAIAREAVERAAGYRQRHPADLRGLETLASARFHVAWTALRGEQVDLWRRALDDYDELLAARPASAEAQRNVALVEKYLAGVMPPEQAEAHHRRAVELDEKRLAATPDDRQAQLDTAISIAGLARALEHRGDLDETLRLLDRSVAIRRRLADTDPANVQTRALLGSVLSDSARVLRGRGDLASARSRGREAAGILALVAQVTRDRWADERLAYAWLEIGRTEHTAHDRAAGCGAFRRAHELYRRHPDADASLAAEAAREAAACR
jgi:tetratricopeptide (TPR) repeat protein